MWFSIISSNASFNQTFTLNCRPRPKPIRYSDNLTVVWSAGDVIHYVEAVEAVKGKSRLSVRINHSAELKKANQNLNWDVQRLGTSPHAIPPKKPTLEQPPPGLTPETVGAVQSTIAIVDIMPNRPRKEVASTTMYMELLSTVVLSWRIRHSISIRLTVLMKLPKKAYYFCSSYV